MKIVKAGHEHIPQTGLTPYQFVERVGRTCYKSEDKITEDSAEKFVKGLVGRGHTAMTEHFWVHMTFKGQYNTLKDHIENFVWNVLKDGGDMSTFFRFMQITYLPDVTYLSFPIRAVTDFVDKSLDWLSKQELSLIKEMFYEVWSSYPMFFSEKCFKEFSKENMSITGLFSVWSEESFLDLLKKQDFSDIEEDKDTEIMKHITHTVLFKCDRGVSHELVRHRPCSFAQESTRYCNYSQDKFGKEITVIEPLWLHGKNVLEWENWEKAIRTSEMQYFKLLEEGWTPQEARSVLPNSLKTEIVMTANETGWQHIVNLRAKQTTGKAHPQMVEIMYPWYEELKVLSEGRIV